MQKHLVLGLLHDREGRHELLAKELHQGIALSQLPQSFIERAGQTKRQVVRATADGIARLQPATTSLMPLGLEGTLTPQDLADLIRWIKSGESD